MTKERAKRCAESTIQRKTRREKKEETRNIEIVVCWFEVEGLKLYKPGRSSSSLRRRLKQPLMRLGQRKNPVRIDERTNEIQKRPRVGKGTAAKILIGQKESNTPEALLSREHKENQELFFLSAIKDNTASTRHGKAFLSGPRRKTYPSIQNWVVGSAYMRIKDNTETGGRES